MSGYGRPGNRARVARRALDLRSRGMTTTAIAEQLGKSRSYIAAVIADPSGADDRARKDSYRRPCPSCGTLMSGHDGPKSRKAPSLCLSCSRTAQMAEKQWTREAVIAAIQLFALRHGRPPLATEWIMPAAVRGSEYPPASAVYRYEAGSRGGVRRSAGKNNPFESWAEAIEAAGFPRPQQGRKVHLRGQGVSHMKRIYYVLSRNGDDAWHEQQVEAYSPEQAIEEVASTEGEYVAVLDRYFVQRRVGQVTKLAVLRDAD